METINNHEPFQRPNPLNDFLFLKVMAPVARTKVLAQFFAYSGFFWGYNVLNLVMNTAAPCYYLLGDQGDEPQLIGFLNAVLSCSHMTCRSGKKPIESLEIKENKKFEKDAIDGKSCILDVLAVLQDGTKVNIEVQLRNEHNMDQRSLFYWSKLYSTSLNEGENYRELPNVVAINIVDFDFLPGDNFHTCFHLREDADPSLILSFALEIHFVNMVKWRRQREKTWRIP